MSAPSVLWHAYPLGLLGADQTGADRTCRRSLRELVEWLPHLDELGADTLLLGPIFASLSHGYDTVTHHDVDDRLGELADVDALVAAAEQRGVGVVLDGAFAYASRSFWRLADPAEAADPWFRRDADGALVPWRVDSLVTPDYGSFGYRNYVADVMSTWLDRGIRGWRLDSAWSVPAGFWRAVLTRVRERHPTAWFLGQVFDDDLPPVLNSNLYSSATEYAVMHGTREWLSGGPADPMAATLRLHAHNSSRLPVHTFVGNHDFARLADVLPVAVVPLAFAVLLTLPGVPGVYYGDELGVRSTWSQGGPDALLRPTLTLGDLAGLSSDSEVPLETVRQLGAFRKANPWLAGATLTGVTSFGDTLTYEVRGDGGEGIVVLLNPTPTDASFATAVSGVPLVGTAAATGTRVTVPPHGWAVYAAPSIDGPA